MKKNNFFKKINNKKILQASILVIFFVLPSFASAMSITLNIPEKYSEIKAGEKVYFETSVKWPENTDRKDLRIEYSVKNKDGEEIAYLKVLKAIETQASFFDSISIPESTAKGLYRITANIGDYKLLDQEVSASFYVNKGGDPVTTYLLIITGILSVVVIFVLAEMYFLMRRHNH